MPKVVDVIQTYVDGRWGIHEYSRHPQWYIEEVTHIACIPGRLSPPEVPDILFKSLDGDTHWEETPLCRRARPWPDEGCDSRGAGRGSYLRHSTNREPQHERTTPAIRRVSLYALAIGCGSFELSPFSRDESSGHRRACSASLSATGRAQDVPGGRGWSHQLFRGFQCVGSGRRRRFPPRKRSDTNLTPRWITVLGVTGRVTESREA